MKRSFVFLLAMTLLVIPLTFAGGKGGSKSTRVKDYLTKKGTYVAPHYRTTPDKTKLNNMSTAGNYNPLTEKDGTRNP